MFGVSNKTIIKYRQTGILPYTKLGDIFYMTVGRLIKYREAMHHNSIFNQLPQN
jgi:hypothetical protein